jgi:hypothetical protein
MEANRFEVPKMKRDGVTFSAPAAARQAAVKIAAELVQNGTFTAPILVLGRVEKEGFPWYNFDSRQTNLSIRHFNNLKSIHERSPELGLRSFPESVFKA